jgi:hypothetical protein
MAIIGGDAVILYGLDSNGVPVPLLLNSDGTLSSTGSSGVSDHGALTGLSDNDHPQYALASSIASPGLVLLEQHTAAASATLDFTSFISSTYDQYLFELVDIVPATDDTIPYMRVGTGGGPTYDAGNNYGWTGWRWLNSGSGTSGAASGEAQISLTLAIHKAANWPPLCGSLKLFNPQSSSTNKLITGQFETFDTAANLPLGTVLAASYQAVTAITAVRFLMSSGNITSGTIRVYGVAK